MNDEFNKLPTSDFCKFDNEFSKQPKEWTFFSENLSTREFPAIEETYNLQNQTKHRVKKIDKKSTLRKLLAFTAAAVVTVTASVTIFPVATDSKILELYSTDASIGYYIIADESKHDLILQISNDNTKRTIDLLNGENAGDVLDLEPNMEYSVSILEKSGRNTNTKTQKIKTLSIMNQAIFYGIDYTPAKNAQGVFNYTPHFKNYDNTWSDFYITITDEYGFSIETAINGNGINHSVRLSDFVLASHKANFEIYALTGEDEASFIYSKNIILTQTETEWKGLTYTPAQNSDQPFAFTPKFIDQNGYWKNLTAYVVDVETQTSAQVLITESDKLHLIIFSEMELTSSQVEFQVYASVNTSEELSDSILVYNQLVTLITNNL